MMSRGSRGDPSLKLAIAIDPLIHEKILAAAARDGVSVSAWMTAAAREALQRRAGLASVALWEKQYGRLTTAASTIPALLNGCVVVPLGETEAHEAGRLLGMI